jgi:hypothetical protein
VPSCYSRFAGLHKWALDEPPANVSGDDAAVRVAVVDSADRTIHGIGELRVAEPHPRLPLNCQRPPRDMSVGNRHTKMSGCRHSIAGVDLRRLGWRRTDPPDDPISLLNSAYRVTLPSAIAEMVVRSIINRRNTYRAQRRVVEDRGVASFPRSWQNTAR